jgi:hypothetical protein
MQTAWIANPIARELTSRLAAEREKTPPITLAIQMSPNKISTTPAILNPQCISHLLAT